MLEAMRYKHYPALQKREESQWCKGDEGRLHVTEEHRAKNGVIRLICKYCGRLCAIRIDKEAA